MLIIGMLIRKNWSLYLSASGMSNVWSTIENGGAIFTKIYILNTYFWSVNNKQIC